MEVSVVHCQEIKPSFTDHHDHFFSFPKEWETEECIWLTGIWLSHEDAVSWVQLRYHELRIDSSPLRVDDDMKWLSKFDFPIVIQKQRTGRSFCITADKEIEDFAVTFQWSSISSSIDDDNAQEYTFFCQSFRWNSDSRFIGAQEGETKFIQMRAKEENDETFKIRPVEDLIIESNIPYTVVSSNTIRVDGPCNMSIMSAQTTVIYTFWIVRGERP